uniref:Uncharacterized protein n=1 Tax=Rhizophora mucronata TaxID=61149 RepID=A0A2P2IVQ0_RHIMU
MSQTIAKKKRKECIVDFFCKLILQCHFKLQTRSIYFGPSLPSFQIVMPFARIMA